MITDKVADLLTRIRNAQAAGHKTVSIPASKLKEQVLKVLGEEGYIGEVKASKDDNDKPILVVGLRYAKTGEPAIRELKRLSTPGRRLYVKTEEISKYRGGLGTVVVSTSKGIVSDTDARKLGIGGELICSVF